MVNNGRVFLKICNDYIALKGILLKIQWMKKDMAEVHGNRTHPRGC